MPQALTTDVGILKAQMSETNTKIDKIDNKVDRLDQKFDQFIDKLDNRYASKLSERLIYGMVALILIGVLGALLAMVIKPTQINNTSTSQAPKSVQTPTASTPDPAAVAQPAATAQSSPPQTSSSPVGLVKEIVGKLQP